jgi:hypothetical protein
MQELNLNSHARHTKHAPDLAIGMWEDVRRIKSTSEDSAVVKMHVTAEKR